MPTDDSPRQGGGQAGYSGTPLLKKLGVKAEHHVAMLAAPEPLPEGLDALQGACSQLSRSLRGSARFDVIVLFADRLAELRRRFSSAAARLQPAGGLWIAWPKRSSGVATDVTEDRVREVALAEGLVDNKVCAIDAIWSGLRCVIPVANRR
ncbi:MAG: hypothetical protein KC503_21070 [Myxococcales bacterium]|nr:hypothetical protein [Myxococcales bacterium]